MSDKICYIPLRTGEDLLFNAVKSLYDQVDAFMVINSTEKDLFPLFEEMDKGRKVNFINPTDPLCFEQAINVAIKHAYWLHQAPYIIWAHNDIVVSPGAIDALLETYEQVKDTKWGVIYGQYDVLCMFNPKFFIEENIWGDPALFPNYFGDNHRYRLMDLRGYARINAPNVADKVTHIGSQTIRNSAYHGRINALTFDLESQLYVRIWGGIAPNETNADSTCGGLYPLKG